MPAKSILETRIRERLDEANARREKINYELEMRRKNVAYAEADLTRVRGEIFMLKGLLAPDGPGEDGVPGEDGLPGGAPDNVPGGGVASNE